MLTRYAQLKRIYFVRHGVTEANERDAFQTFETPLSDKGLTQARFVAQRFATIPVERIITSTMLRAKETAHEISVVAHCAVEESPLFHELLRPTVIRGRERDEPEVQAVYKEILASFADPSKRHSDEENFFDAKTRSLKALRFLEERPEQELAVVTHGTILKMLITTTLHGSEATPEEFARLDYFLHPSNTGITKCVLTKHGWRLWTWNDLAHLGEVR
jgi:2,3-bisphosphoglycerate-dependent phosphoglycerate mutase